jgi:predicted nucleotidyltransferase
MVTKQGAIEMAQAFVRDCATAGMVFDKVLLFGSYAKGTAHKDSDIDLLLVSKRFTDDVLANLRLYSKINIQYPIIETHPISPNNLLQAEEFIKAISSEAVEILNGAS